MKLVTGALILIMASCVFAYDVKADGPTWRQTYLGAMTQEKAGDWQGALQAAKSALDKANYSFGRTSLNAAKSNTLLGDLYASRGKYVSASMHYNNGIVIREGLFGPGHPSNAKAWACLAELHAARGKLQQAKDCFRKAILHGQNGDPMNESRALIGLADLDAKRGEIGESVALLTRALDICEYYQKYQEPMRLLHVRCHFNLGQIQMSQGNCLQAADSYKNALNVLESSPNPNGLLRYAILSRVRDAYQDAGHNKHAENYGSRARMLYNRLESPIRLTAGSGPM